MSSRNLQKIETRQRIIDQAVSLFTKQGFVQTTTAQIATASGLSHGSVFAHFASREALILEVTEQMGRKITDRLHLLAASGKTLKDILNAHLQCLTEHEELYIRLLVEKHLLPAQFQFAWIALQSAVSFYVMQTAEQEIKTSKICNLSKALLFNTWIGLIHHYLMQKDWFAPSGSVLEAHGQTLLHHYLTLLTASK